METKDSKLTLSSIIRLVLPVLGLAFSIRATREGITLLGMPEWSLSLPLIFGLAFLGLGLRARKLGYGEEFFMEFQISGFFFFMAVPGCIAIALNMSQTSGHFLAWLALIVFPGTAFLLGLFTLLRMRKESRGDFSHYRN